MDRWIDGQMDLQMDEYFVTIQDQTCCSLVLSKTADARLCLSWFSDKKNCEIAVKTAIKIWKKISFKVKKELFAKFQLTCSIIKLANKFLEGWIGLILMYQVGLCQN